MKKVLDVGQCAADHFNIRRLIEDNFEAHVVQSHSARQTIERLRAETFDLVLVNRLLDADSSEGLDIVATIKTDAALRSTPVMLVTNYPDPQEQAVSAGAEPGFGKAQIDGPETLERLRKFLG